MAETKLTKAQRGWMQHVLFDDSFPPGQAWVMHFADDPERQALVEAGLVTAIRYGTDTWWVEATLAGRAALTQPETPDHG